jgi:hypothetical protein
MSPIVVPGKRSHYDHHLRREPPETIFGKEKLENVKQSLRHYSEMSGELYPKKDPQKPLLWA